MPNYNDARGAADLLSQFDFNITSEGPGSFSIQHRKYICEFSEPGIESFATTYQSNPDVCGQPTTAGVFAVLVNDALAVDGLFVDTSADELGFEKPSQTICTYESYHKTPDWLKNDVQFTTSEISNVAETLDNELGEVREEVERVQAERKAKHEFEHPPVPKSFVPIEDLQACLDLGEYSGRIVEKHDNIGGAFGEIADSNIGLSNYDLLKQLPDNYEQLEETDSQDLLKDYEGGFIKMTQIARYEYFTQDMYNYRGDIVRYAAPGGLKEAGVYTLTDDTYDDVFDDITVDFDDNNVGIEDFVGETQNAIRDATDGPLYDTLGSNDGILGDGELSGGSEAIRKFGYNFSDPCAVSIEAMRTINGKGYEAAFNEFWKDFMPEDHRLAASRDVALILVTFHFNEIPNKSKSMTFSTQDTNELDIDDKMFFSGPIRKELTGMVGEQTGEDSTTGSTGEPYQVEAHPKSQEPSQPYLAEKAEEARDGLGKLEQDSRDG